MYTWNNPSSIGKTQINIIKTKINDFDKKKY